MIEIEYSIQPSGISKGNYTIDMSRLRYLKRMLLIEAYILPGFILFAVTTCRPQVMLK